MCQLKKNCSNLADQQFYITATNKTYFLTDKEIENFKTSHVRTDLPNRPSLSGDMQ